MDSKYFKFLVIIVIAFLVGILVDRSMLQKNPNVTNQQPAVSKNSLFQTQSATLQGKITKVSDNNITVENDKGEFGTFTASPRMVIYKFNSGSRQATSSSDLKSIEQNQTVILTLTLSGNDYQIASISYIPSKK